MSYIDRDGDEILETRREISEFIALSECPFCYMDGLEMLELIDNPNVSTHRIVFASKCEHNPLQGGP